MFGISNPFRLLRLVMVLVVVYLFLGMLCASLTGHFFMVTKEYDSNQFDDHQWNEALCPHCVQRHIGRNLVQTLTERQKFHPKRDKALKAIQASCNFVSILNYFIIFLTFGGSKSITRITLLFSFVSIAGFIYIEKMAEIIFFESVVALVSFAVLLIATIVFSDPPTAMPM